jgi:hypothetical protein
VAVTVAVADSVTVDGDSLADGEALGSTSESSDPRTCQSTIPRAARATTTNAQIHPFDRSLPSGYPSGLSCASY